MDGCLHFYVCIVIPVLQLGLIQILKTLADKTTTNLLIALMICSFVSSIFLRVIAESKTRFSMKDYKSNT